MKGIFALANAAWFLMLPGTFWYYNFRASRGDYAWFSDTISIPMMSQLPVILFVFIPLNIFILLSFIQSNIPSKLFIRPVDYTAKEILKEVFWGFFILLNAFTLVLFVADGDHFSIIVNLIFTYILLALRAGQINRPIIVENIPEMDIP
ncbi:MAG: hypothetical protein QM726_15245 [Chitinophagaceae bacterium]